MRIKLTFILFALILTSTLTNKALADCSSFGPSTCTPSCGSTCNYWTCDQYAADTGITINVIPYTWAAMDVNCNTASGQPHTISTIRSSQSETFNYGSYISHSQLPMTLHLGHGGASYDLSAPFYGCMQHTSPVGPACAVPGACGPDTGPRATAPVNLCAAGSTASAVTGTWDWTCTGANGGSIVPCSATSNAGVSCLCKFFEQPYGSTSFSLITDSGTAIAANGDCSSLSNSGRGIDYVGTATGSGIHAGNPGGGPSDFREDCAAWWGGPNPVTISCGWHTSRAACTTNVLYSGQYHTCADINQPALGCSESQNTGVSCMLDPTPVGYDPIGTPPYSGSLSPAVDGFSIAMGGGYIAGPPPSGYGPTTPANGSYPTGFGGEQATNACNAMYCGCICSDGTPAERLDGGPEFCSGSNDAVHGCYCATVDLQTVDNICTGAGGVGPHTYDSAPDEFTCVRQNVSADCGTGPGRNCVWYR